MRSRHFFLLNNKAWVLLLVVCVLLLLRRDPPPVVEPKRRTLSLCVMVTGLQSQHALRLLLLSLSRAPYPRHTAIHLTVVSPVAYPDVPSVPWHHGEYRLVHRMPWVDDCTVFLEDTMEVSPIFAYWYVDMCGREFDVLSGGDSVGLVLAVRHWRRFKHRIYGQIHSADQTKNLIAALLCFIEERNLTVVHPRRAGGYVYVRATRQSPVAREEAPRLERVLDRKYIN